MLPDDCGECRSCGVPVFGRYDLCIDCEPVRDERGRFVPRDVADRYRALLKRSLGWYGASREDELEARRQLYEFWRTA